MELDLPGMQKKVKGTASVFKRLLSLIVDLVIINFVLVSPFQGLFRAMFGEVREASYAAYQEMFMNSPHYSLFVFSLMMISILALIYLSVLQYKFGQTIGQIIMRLHVKPENGEIRYWQCVMRNLFIIPLFPFLLLWVIDPIYMFFDKDGRKLTEVLSKTKTEQEYVMQYGQE